MQHHGTRTLNPSTLTANPSPEAFIHNPKALNPQTHNLKSPSLHLESSEDKDFMGFVKGLGFSGLGLRVLGFRV